MKRSFSFTEKPVLFILKLLPNLLPGIEKVVAVYWSPEKNNLVSTILKNDNGEYSEDAFHVSDSTSILTRLRSDNAPYSWLRIEDLPFDIKPKEKIQLNIFNELNNNILLIRIKNVFDDHNDLFFFYFNQDFSNFGTVSPKKILSTDNKTIIAHLIRNSILAQLNIHQDDKELFATLNENTFNILSDANDLRKKVSDLNEKLQDGIIYLCYSYLSEISGNNLRTYQLSESGVCKLKGFQGDIENLKIILEKAAKYADAMVPERTNEAVIISDFHLFFDIEKEQKVTEATVEHIGEVPVKYAKTFILLDRMEHAAEQLKSQNKVLTSSNLGNEFPKPISPPAITDALKKHKSKILYLFKEYPNRWPVIRKEFRPVQNILNTKPLQERQTA
jgi:hypothetical protein